MSKKGNRAATAASEKPNHNWLWCGVLFALVYPSIITWGYFVLASKYSTGTQQGVYLAVKVFQFVFPILWVRFVLQEPLRTGRVSRQGLLLGAVFSLLVVGAGWLLFDYLLRDLVVFNRASGLIREKIRGFGIHSFWAYVVLAGFYSLCHSLLEEYYWRWFVFRHL